MVDTTYPYKTWKLKCPSINEWETKSALHTYCRILLTTERNGLLIHRTIWVNLKIIILSDFLRAIKKYILYDSFILRAGKCTLIYSDRKRVHGKKALRWMGRKK